MSEGTRGRMESIAARPWRSVPAAGRERSRWLAIGDPQTTFEKVMDVLRLHDALDEATGMLRDDVGLLSIGDHFDFGARGGPEIGLEGELLLRWLVEHPVDQTVVLLGNHDLARVQELALENDVSFAAARALALEIRAERDDEKREAMRARFHRDFPRIPTPEIAARDYSGFATSQRALVRALLRERRVKLGQAALRQGVPLLFTHAGITDRELSILELPNERAPTTLAAVLNRSLARAVDEVAAAWGSDEDAPLDLAPLHVMGTTAREGGGLCYHRPANRARAGADLRWELDAHAPRRFDPRTLPRPLVQACGHSGHRKCVLELDAWVTASARETEQATLRTLRTDGEQVTYDVGVVDARSDEATLYLIDGEIDRVPAERVGLLSFDRPLD